MPNVLTMPLSKSRVFQIWLRSFMLMSAPATVTLISVSIYEGEFEAPLLIAVLIGSYAAMIEHENLFEVFYRLPYPFDEYLATFFGITLVAAWPTILCLPAFDRFEKKGLFRTHALQLIYASVQAGGLGYLLIAEKI